MFHDIQFIIWNQAKHTLPGYIIQYLLGAKKNIKELKIIHKKNNLKFNDESLCELNEKFKKKIFIEMDLKYMKRK